jgi:hypothetical protein
MADQDGQRPGPAGAVRGSGLAMVLICGAPFALQLDFSIVNVACRPSRLICTWPQPSCGGWSPGTR